MRLSEIISEINKLPVNQQFVLIELLQKKLKENKLKVAADMLFHDYTNDSELIAFSKF